MQEYRGRIVGSVGGLYSVLCDRPTPSGRLISCRARGLFRHKQERPIVGDFVEIDFEDQGGGETAVLSRIHERRNSLIRPPIANLDYIFVTLAVASPAPDAETADKLIAIAEFNRITPVIIIGKIDLDGEAASKLASIYRLAGYDVFQVSPITGEGIGELCDFVSAALPGRVAAFAGASGVGKSSLINRLFPELSLEISDVSRKTERGRHTTRQVTLHPLPSGEAGNPGFIADTPGFSALDFERFDFFGREDLPGSFREFKPYITSCRFTKCGHTKETGCAVIAALREGKIAPSRHESYVKLYEILKNKHPWDSK